MEALGLQEQASPTSETVVSLGVLSELTGFPVDYIKRELFLGEETEEEMSVEQLRLKVLAYLDSSF